MSNLPFSSGATDTNMGRSEFSLAAIMAAFKSYRSVNVSKNRMSAPAFVPARTISA